MSWDGHVAKERMSGIEAMPQGDPWGPLALNIYMWAGHTWVDEELKGSEIEAPHEVYMDDRTWAAATAREATWPIGVWARFSDAILLMENPGKVQLTARNATLKKCLQQCLNSATFGSQDFGVDCFLL